MLIPGLDADDFMAASGACAGFVTAEAFCMGAAEGAATLAAVAFAVGAGAIILRAGSAPFVAADGTARVALAATTDAPMLRAPDEDASFVAFSRIAFCLSSSLARMGTRSSGIGLLSCRGEKVSRVSIECVMMINLETLAELDQLRHAFVHLAFHQCLTFLSQSLLLVGDEVAECWKGIRGRLYIIH